MERGQNNKTEIFETRAVPAALAVMAIPTIISQLITLVYNMADLWFIGRTNNPYMVGAAALVATVFLMMTALSNLFGVGGGTLVVRLLGRSDEEEARKVASVSLTAAACGALVFSLSCLVFMNPLLRLLGASDNTIGYARQYLFFVVVLGGLPTVLSNTMSSMLRNTGYSRQAAFGLGMGGVLNVILDPIFMFLVFPDGYQVMGAAVATLLSNVTACFYYVITYRRVSRESVLALPRRVESIRRDSVSSILSVGLPAACSLLLFDLTNIIINMLSASHGDLELAAIGIVLKVERLPLNVGIGICLGMVPLTAYNYASGNRRRMREFFSAARAAGMVVALGCVVLYHVGAPWLIRLFIEDPRTVELGTRFLQARCFATPVMFLSFHMVHFMQSVGKGKYSFWLAVIRQLCLNIPILFLFNALFGMTGIIWTQVTADLINVVISYLIYGAVKKQLQ